MLKPLMIGAVALTGVTAAATPAAADRWDDDDRYERDYRYERGRDYRHDRGRYHAERSAQIAYRDGLLDGRRGYRNDKHEYRAKFMRRAYQDGFRDGRRQAHAYRYDRHEYRDYRPIRYDRRADYRGDWYGRDGRRYDSYERCRSGNGVNAGTVLGGIAGGVLGNEIAKRGDKAVGTIIGAAAGAVIGHEVGKDDDKRRYCY